MVTMFQNQTIAAIIKFSFTINSLTGLPTTASAPTTPQIDFYESTYPVEYSTDSVLRSRNMTTVNLPLDLTGEPQFTNFESSEISYVTSHYTDLMIPTTDSTTTTTSIITTISNAISIITKISNTTTISTLTTATTKIYSLIDGTNLSSIMAELEKKSFFLMTDLSVRAIDLLLENSGYDMTGCLTNCSNHGICILNSFAEICCKCDNFFSGESCQFNSQPCARTLCLNGGSCTNLNIGYDCSCASGFYGKHCELKKNPCRNQTCFHHGFCVNNNSGAQCNCFRNYLGNECEIEGENILFQKKVQLVASTTAIVTISSLFAVMFINDVIPLLVWLKSQIILFI